jgi:2-pyrone-4,6-dicarboxylate lactonase
MAEFIADKNWIPFHPNPSKPAFTLPAGTVDAHCHVFGPGDIFPYAPERKYTPCDASKAQLFALHQHLGIDKCVIVQATCHGSDNRALLDALQAADGKARGVVSITPDISDETLAMMHAAGVRGVRFNFVKRLVNPKPDEYYFSLAEKIAKYQWHIVIYFEPADLIERQDLFTSLPTTVVVDHMGRPDVRQPIDHEDFQRFLDFMAKAPNVWSKVSCPDRLTHIGEPNYEDVVPFARKVVETFPDRVLWGTDWPHPNMTKFSPDDGLLVDFIPKIAVTPTLQQKLLVDNPMRLYWS